MTGQLLGADAIRAMLRELSEELAAAGETATLFVVGGAAMSLAFYARRVTGDVDAAFRPSAAVRDAAARVSARRGLAEDWLNDGAKGFMPGTDPGASLEMSTPSLRVELASAEYLLAMKIMAARVEQDTEDVAFLYGHLGLTTVEQGVDLVVKYYGQAVAERTFQMRSQYVLEGVVAGLGSRPSPGAGPGAGRGDGDGRVAGTGGVPQPVPCARCGRTLYSERSIRRGTGPGCARRG